MPGERPTRADGGPHDGGSRHLSKFQHDARNQLNLIIGYVDLLQRSSTSLNAEHQSYLQQIRSAAVSLGGMVEALRDP